MAKNSTNDKKTKASKARSLKKYPLKIDDQKEMQKGQLKPFRIVYLGLKLSGLQIWNRKGLMQIKMHKPFLKDSFSVPSSKARGIFSQSGRVNSLSQVRNTLTGHYFTRDAHTGQLISSGDKPIQGVKVVRVFKSASNPSISKETAALAEMAVLALGSRSSKK